MSPLLAGKYCVTLLEPLEKALTKLQKNGVHIRWISALDFPEDIGDNIRKKLDSFICYDDGITEAVSQCFNIPYDDIAMLAREEVPKNLQPIHDLVEAAMYFYRNYQACRYKKTTFRDILTKITKSCIHFMGITDNQICTLQSFR